MPLTNAQKQARWRERNQVVLTEDARAIARKLILMERKKLRAVVTRVNRYLKQTTGMSAAKQTDRADRIWAKKMEAKGRK
jgi:hypothetical protein